MVETKWIIIGIIILLLLACAIVVFLPTILYLMGGFIGPNTGSLETQSKSYWSSSAPVAIHNFRASGDTLNLELQNVDLDIITITDISIDGVSVLSTSTEIEPGEQKSITATLGSECGMAGEPFSYNVIITYAKGTLTGLTQVGTKPLIGKCS
ncbi:MAG: hypothetical protein ABID61_05285 [Candidatus Micrarchaeota archaeon]